MGGYGWPDFDQAVVEAIARGDQGHVRKDADGGMRCPLLGHDEWLPWQEGDHTKGTVAHSCPEVVLRVSRTYVLCNPLDNFIIGRDLASELLAGDWGKAETRRLGHENSEDALSFNVFRSLQKVGELSRVAQLVTGEPVPEPDLYLWGRRVEPNGSSRPWDALATARRRIEPAHLQQTEPDVCLHVPDCGWIFIEAKLGSGTKTLAREKTLGRWLDAYSAHASSLLDLHQLQEIEPSAFPEQLMRNLIFANAIRAPEERAHVVALSRARDRAPIEAFASSCLASDSHVSVSRMSWEEIYTALPEDSERLTPLRTYLQNKSYKLRPAFELSRPNT